MEVQILPCVEQLFRSASVRAAAAAQQLNVACHWPPHENSAPTSLQVKQNKWELPNLSPVGNLQLISCPIMQNCNTEIAELIPEYPPAFAAVYNFQTGNGVKWEQGSNTWRPSSLFKAAWMPLWSTATWTSLVAQPRGLCRSSCCRLMPVWDMLPIHPIELISSQPTGTARGVTDIFAATSTSVGAVLFQNMFTFHVFGVYWIHLGCSFHETVIYQKHNEESHRPSF